MNTIDLGHIGTGLGQLSQHSNLDSGQARTGTLLGNTVTHLEGEISSLGDAAEEISLHMAEKTESKHHAERKVKSERPTELMQAAEILEMLQQTQDPNAQAKLEALVTKLLSGNGSIRQQTAQAFGDVSQQYLALQYALRQGEQSGASAELLESLRDALADLEIESGPQIRAGLNTLDSAAAFADNAPSFQAFQDTYRDIVLGENSLGKTLELALTRFGNQNIDRGLKQLVLALGQDLAAARPSISTSRLQALSSDLYHLQVAVTVLDGCASLSEELRSKGQGQPDSERLMQELVTITGEKWLNESRFTSLAKQHGAILPEARVAFLAGTKTLLRDLPVQVFSDADARQSTLNALQDALDIAIEEEGL